MQLFPRSNSSLEFYWATVVDPSKFLFNLQLLRPAKFHFGPFTKMNHNHEYSCFNSTLGHLKKLLRLQQSCDSFLDFNTYKVPQFCCICLKASQIGLFPCPNIVLEFPEERWLIHQNYYFVPVDENNLNLNNITNSFFLYWWKHSLTPQILFTKRKILCYSTIR